MGEAKRRKAVDPYYGMKPKAGRGVFLSAPITFVNGNMIAASSSIDPGELRRATLFWDRLVWPNSRIISFGSNADEEFLQQEGILIRPRPTRLDREAGVGAMQALVHITNSADITLGIAQSRFFAQQHIEEFLALDQAEPGQWVMAEGEGSIILDNGQFLKNRGQLLTLARAVPLPSANIPIAEILEFKHRRSDEIYRLAHELDKLYIAVADSEDSRYALEVSIREVDLACRDSIAVASESKWPFHIGDLNISLSLNNFESAINRAATWELIGGRLGLPFVGAFLGSASAFISLEHGLGAKRLAQRQSPFRVVGHMHRELVPKK